MDRSLLLIDFVNLQTFRIPLSSFSYIFRCHVCLGVFDKFCRISLIELFIENSFYAKLLFVAIWKIGDNTVIRKSERKR